VLVAGLVAISSIANLGAGGTAASSHREAPLISQDPPADNTDVYAFVSPDEPDTVTLIANFYPDQSPAGAPNFYRFGDDVVYDIHVDSNGDAIEDIIYRFDFLTELRNPDTFNYNTGPIDSLDDEDWNIRQIYAVSELRGGEATVLAEGLIVPPAYVGTVSIPDYESLAEDAVYGLDNGATVFAGQREEGFFIDIASLGDLLTVRELPGNAGGGVDGLAEKNVLSIALQLPFELVTSDGAAPEDAEAANAIIGVWATASRPSTTVINADGTRVGSGDLVQVSRLGMPLVNELVVPSGTKDFFNASIPSADAQFLPAVLDPELPGLLSTLYGIDVPTEDRNDLVTVFLTGVPGLNQPADVVPAEMLRLNLGIPPADDPDPLGVLGGDTAGFPNGRRPADDIVDIELRVVAGVLFSDEFDVEPNNQLGDGVDENDQDFLDEFPYLAVPYPGFDGDATGDVDALGGDTATEEPEETATAEADETVTAEPEATDEATEEPTVEATEEPTEEPTATEEPIEEPTEEPTEEATAEATESVGRAALTATAEAALTATAEA